MSAKDGILDRHKDLLAFLDRNPEIAKQVQIVDQDRIGFHAILHGQTERFDFPFHSGAFREILDEGIAYFAQVKFDQMTNTQRGEAGLDGILPRMHDIYFRDLDSEQQRAVIERFFPAVDTDEQEADNAVQEIGAQGVRQ